MNKKLYVCNLDWGINSDELREIFIQAGEIIEAAVILDRDTGRSRGFGFVTMKTEDGAQKAIKELDGITVKNRQLLVKEAKPQPGREDREDSEFIQQIKDFVLSGTEASMGFEVNGHHFTITEDEDQNSLVI